MLTLITNKATTDYTKKIDSKISNIARMALENMTLGFTNKVDYNMVDILSDLKDIYIAKGYGSDHLCSIDMSMIKFYIDKLTNNKF